MKLLHSIVAKFKIYHKFHCYSWYKWAMLILMLLVIISMIIMFNFNTCLVKKGFAKMNYLTVKDLITPRTNESQRNRLKKRLPNALIIGVKKCGTRALLEFLKLHPDIRAANSEIHFFDRNYNKGLEWYRKQMPLSLEHNIVMEKTPAYWISKEAPNRIKKMNKNIKLLVVVRDPVVRAVSGYAQTSSKRTLATMASFEQLAFMNETNGGIIDTRWGPIRLGIYSRYLTKWLRHFPKSQMLFIDGETLITDPAHEIYRAQDFLRLKRLITAKNFYFNNTKGFPCVIRYTSQENQSIEHNNLNVTFLENSPKSFLNKTKERSFNKTVNLKRFNESIENLLNKRNYLSTNEVKLSSMPKCLGKTKGRPHPKVDEAALKRLRDFYRPFNQYFFSIIGVNFNW